MARRTNAGTQFASDGLKPLKTMTNGVIPDDYPTTLGDFFRMQRQLNVNEIEMRTTR